MMADGTAGEHIRVGHQTPIHDGHGYVESVRGRGIRVFLMGQLVSEPVDHPMIRPSINAMASTYDLAVDDPEVATAELSIFQTFKRLS